MKKIGILHGELSKTIAELAHDDMILIGDAGMPVPEGVKMIDLALKEGVPHFLDVLEAVMREMLVAEGMIDQEMAEVSPHMREELERVVKGSFPLRTMPHEEVKKLSAKAKAVIRTGEFTSYSNINFEGGRTVLEGYHQMKNENILEIKGVSKSFVGVKALQNVSFQVRKGDVHALLGENGAGKSTLMKILSGAYSKDCGQIFVNGKEAEIRNTKDSESLGIAIIYQELNLIPDITVAENIFLARQPKKHGLLNWKKMTEDAEEILNYMDVAIDPRAVVSSLSVAQQQMVEIAKAISLHSQLLIMDEPTSTLTEGETRKLFSVINNLKTKGISMIYISHRMEEIFEICDSYTVLRGWNFLFTAEK